MTVAANGMRVAVGEELSRFQLPVDVSKAREMATALQAPGWASDGPAALAGRPVVPTFTATSGFWQDRLAIMRGPLALDVPRVLHGEQRWRYARLPRVGELLEGATTLADVSERDGRRGGTMRFVTLRTRYAAGDDAVLEEDMVLVETAALPARGTDGGAPARPGTTPAEAPSRPLAAPWEVPGLRPTDLVRYAGASGDFNPIHHDAGYAAEHGLSSIFAMGMLQGGMVGVYAAEHAGGSLRALSLRFRDRLWPDEGLVISGWWDDDAAHACTLEARTARDRRVVLTGTAEVGEA